MHNPVLLNETIDALNIKPGGVYIDATFGRGGHSTAILTKLPYGQLIVIDKDPAAIAIAKEKFDTDPRVIVCHGSFANLTNFAKEHGVDGKVNGILMDLGVSSPQLDEAERGFSFLRDGPLDMRMDTTQGLSAAQWLEQVSQEELANVLKTFGEERFARRIAGAIVKARAEKPILRTKDLADIVARANPAWEKHKNPATRSFQAIRIAVNNELTDLQQALKEAVDMLAPGGRLAVVSFHSLEDRVVKSFIREQAQGRALPHGLPVTENELSRLAKKVLRAIGKAIKPSAEELADNVRARSAIMRVAEKF